VRSKYLQKNEERLIRSSFLATVVMSKILHQNQVNVIAVIFSLLLQVFL